MSSSLIFITLSTLEAEIPRSLCMSLDRELKNSSTQVEGRFEVTDLRVLSSDYDELLSMYQSNVWKQCGHTSSDDYTLVPAPIPRIT